MNYFAKIFSLQNFVLYGSEAALIVSLWLLTDIIVDQIKQVYKSAFHVTFWVG